MGSITNLFRRGAVYYYRRTIRWRSGQRQIICLSLRTRSLSVARQRATLLAAQGERLLAALEHLTMASLSHAQRCTIFTSQLSAERDWLDSLHVGMVCDGGPKPGDAFQDKLGIMASVCRQWTTQGLPQPGEIDDFGGMDAYVGHAFPWLDADDQWELSLSLGAADIAQIWWDGGADAALHRVAAPSTARNRAEALKALYTAKLAGITAAQEALNNPAVGYRHADVASSTAPYSCEAFADLPHEPLYHLLQFVAQDNRMIPVENDRETISRAYSLKRRS